MADQFDAVAQALRDKKPNLSDDQKKEVYGLFKQATCGDQTVDKPGLLSGFEARGKWDAWEAKKGMSQDDAKAAYVAFCTPLLG
jgi:diazepam-binding inhibitor (GABA receptor modulating acyl-CoA-binding protein)